MTIGHIWVESIATTPTMHDVTLVQHFGEYSTDSHVSSDHDMLPSINDVVWWIDQSHSLPRTHPLW